MESAQTHLDRQKAWGPMGWLPMGSPLGGAFGKHNKKEKCNKSLKIKHFGSRIVFFRTLFGGVLEGVPGGPRESQRHQAPGSDHLPSHLKILDFLCIINYEITKSTVFVDPNRTL